MRLTGSRTYYRPSPPKMPSGLIELMEGLTREVLKNNPTDIYGFCAGHMQKLLEIRDGPPRRKTLSLEEKIAKAQEKVRQRAEKRRQEYDNNLLLMQQCGTDAKANATSNKYTPPLHLQEPVVSVLKNPIHHEQTLSNSSEVEVSHESGTGVGVHMQSEDLQSDNIEETPIKGNNIANMNPEVQGEYKPKNEIDLLESAAKSSDNDSIKRDVPLNDFQKTESVINVDKLENEHSTTNENLSSINDYMLVEQITYGEEQSNDKRTVEEVCTNEQLSSPVKSMTYNDCLLVRSGENIISDSLQTADEKTVNFNEDTNVKPDEINAQTVTVITSNIELPQSNTANRPNDTEEIQKLTVDQIINQLNNIVDIEQIHSQNILEDTKELNTNSFNENLSVELQDSQTHSDMLESLMVKDTDSDITTLITQDSSNIDPMQHEADSSNGNESVANGKTTEVDEVNSNSNITVSADEELHNNTQQLNQINNIDLVNNSISSINNINEIQEIDNIGSDTSTKLTESHPNQDTSNMDLETAAITIQKVFRTFLFKSRASTFDDTANDETIFLDEVTEIKKECDFAVASELNMERRPRGITRMDTVLQTVNEEKSLSISTDESSTLSSAATVIQAHVRGFLVRNKLISNKTVSTNSFATSNSNEPSLTSIEMDADQNKNKTILNIHIVPEGDNYLSRDESLITPMDLSLDSSPPSSINLHPLGYDKSEKRKQLKREDAVQSISPPSNNSGKLSEDVDSVKELPLNDHVVIVTENQLEYVQEGTTAQNVKIDHAENITLDIMVNATEEVPGNIKDDIVNSETSIKQNRESLSKTNSDEMDVVTPFISNADNNLSNTKLVHSGEFHDAVLPTKVSRSDTTVTSEFKNVLVYFLLWNHS